jgi:pimeloyl-ACP methyl ester carboxylesterase/uncharacterized RmlC-like cupin family protein
MTTQTVTVGVTGVGPVPVTVTERGAGRPFLLLHGGAGPQSVDSFAELLAASGRVLVPVHPGFGGTPRPEGLDSMAGLGRLYAGLLDELGLDGVTVIGNSIGGWIAAELALAGSPRVSRVVLVDAAGLKLDDHPAADFFSLTMDQVAELSYYEPDKFRINLDALPEPAKAAMAGNRAALATYGGPQMADPALLGRLAGVTVPVLVVWGEADRMIPPENGQAYAAAIPGARLVVIPHAGHLPQLETPGDLFKVVEDFVVVPVSVVGPADGEVALSGPIQMRILEDGRTTAHRLGLGEITLAPHTSGPPQHRHARHDEGFYVVSGTVRFTVGQQSYDAPARTLVMVPPGAPHTFANPGDEPAVVLNTFTPDLYVQYFRDLHDMIAAGQPVTGPALTEVMARYATEPVGDNGSS